MQYSKCQNCIHNGVCRILMAEAIYSLGQFVRLFNKAQTRKTDSKCILRLDYTCDNFCKKEQKKEK